MLYLSRSLLQPSVSKILYNKEDYNSNELEELRRKHTTYRQQLEELLEEHCRNPFVAVFVALKAVRDDTAASSSGPGSAAAASALRILLTIMV